MKTDEQNKTPDYGIDPSVFEDAAENAADYWCYRAQQAEAQLAASSATEGKRENRRHSRT